MSFSGRSWVVKASREPIGPGPNLWSDDEENVHVDAAGHLHLRATRDGDRWWCAEVVAEPPWGHGLVRWVVETPAAALRNTGVLGLFTWDDSPIHAHRELDIEISRWGRPGGAALSWTVQESGGECRPGPFGDELHVVHELDWRPTQVEFAVGGANASRWRVSHALGAGDARVRMNCWLFGGQPPEGANAIEMVISRVDFTPFRRP